MDVTRRLVRSSIDGGELEVFTSGDGPGVVLVIGGGTDAAVYRRFADRLSARYTVHVYNRRGRGGSAERPADYGLATEIGDLGSVLADAGATRVIGHSVGGYFGLAGARDLPVEKVALFDATVSVDGSFPSTFLDDFERAAAGGDAKEAIRIAGAGLNPGGRSLPMWAQKAAVSAILLTPPGKTMAELIWTVPAESRLAVAADGPADQWASVTAVTRLYVGEKSPGYYLPAARALAAAMPHADVEVIPRLGHDAVARAGAPLVASVGDFLA